MFNFINRFDEVTSCHQNTPTSLLLCKGRINQDKPSEAKEQRLINPEIISSLAALGQDLAWWIRNFTRCINNTLYKML